VIQVKDPSSSAKNFRPRNCLGRRRGRAQLGRVGSCGCVSLIIRICTGRTLENLANLGFLQWEVTDSFVSVQSYSCNLRSQGSG